MPVLAHRWHGPNRQWRSAVADAICPCGVAIPEGAHGNRKYCSAICRTKAKKSAHSAKLCNCGKLTARYNKFCDKCYYAARPKQPCMECEKPTGWVVGDKRGLNKLCRFCRMGIPRHGQRDQRRSRKSNLQPCSVVGCEEMIKARNLCRRHYAKVTAFTDDQFRQCSVKGCRRVRASKQGLCCSHYTTQVYRKTNKGREYHREKSSQRRAKQRNAFVASVDMSAVFKLDGGCCYLCGKRCDPKAPLNHPRQPTIDHVIPLANGGTHEPSNVRLACRKCNCAKAHRGGGEQFALDITM